MNKVRKWAFTAMGAGAAITPYLPVIKPVVKAVSDGLGQHQTTAQVLSGALLAGIVAYQAFKVDPTTGKKPDSPQDTKAVATTVPQNTDGTPQEGQ